MKIRTIIENNQSKAGKFFEIFIQLLIIISLLSFSIETIPNISPKILKWLNIIEIIIVLIFTLEYLLRLYFSNNKLKYIFSFYGMIDLLAILPFYISSGLDLRSIRIFRLLRLFRSFKLLRYSKAIRRFKTAFLMIKEELIVFLTVTFFLIFFSSVGIYYFESPEQPDKFGSVFDCMWWSIVTLTTVGYGDVYPVTSGGKIFTFFILIIGLGIIAVPTGLISSALTRCITEEKENKSGDKS